MKKLCFVLDRSGSMHGSRIEAAKTGVLRFVQDLYSHRAKDIAGFAGSLISYISFNDIVETRLSLCPVSIAIPQLKNALERTAARNMSALWDALGEAVRELSSDEKKAESWIIVLTDGKDNGSHRFSEKKLRSYADNALRDMRMIMIAVGDTVEERKLTSLTVRYSGQYIATATDPLSIKAAYLQAACSFLDGGSLTPKVDMDIPRGRYGTLGSEDLIKLGLGTRRPQEKEHGSADIFKIPLVRLNTESHESLLRKANARKEADHHNFSQAGNVEGAKVYGVLNATAGRMHYAKLKSGAMGRRFGACTCEDFRSNGSGLGIPCKHLWMILGVKDGRKEEHSEHRESVTQLLSLIDHKRLGIKDEQAAALLPIIREKLGPLLYDTMAEMANRRAETISCDGVSTGSISRTTDVQGTAATVPEGRSVRISRGMEYANRMLEKIKEAPDGLERVEILGAMGAASKKEMRKVDITLKFLSMKGLISKVGERWAAVIG